MSLGLRLLAKLSNPCVEPEVFLNQTESWMQTRFVELQPKTRRGEVDQQPSLFLKLHPAAEEAELTLLDQERIVVSANTTTVGPGFHIFLTSLLKDWANEFQAIWATPEESSEEYCD